MEDHADSARAHEAEDGGGADVDLEGVERVGQKVGEDLREGGENGAFERGAPGGGNGFQGPGSMVSRVSAKEFGDEAETDDEQRENAGERADAERGGEQGGENQVGYTVRIRFSRARLRL